MMSLGSLVWHHYVLQKPSSVVLVKAKADIACAREVNLSHCRWNFATFDLQFQTIQEPRIVIYFFAWAFENAYLPLKARQICQIPWIKLRKYTKSWIQSFFHANVIKIYVLSREELLFPLCYEIPCIGMKKGLNLTLGIFPKFGPWHLDGALISATCRKMCVVTLQYKTSFSMRRVHTSYR